jgi:hypothetical protein
MSRAALVLLTVFASTIPASAKEKKAPLPYTVLRAHTIAVIIDPNAGRRMSDPFGNETAQRNVETALRNWGRYEITTSLINADLIVVVRTGGRTVEPTMPDPRQNQRVGEVEPLDDGMGIGAQHGSINNPNQRPGSYPPSTTPNSPSTVPDRAEITSAPDDSLVVYSGGVDKPLDSPAIFRYSAKDALKAPGVSAVGVFRKAVADTEKIATSKNP